MGDPASSRRSEDELDGSFEVTQNAADALDAAKDVAARVGVSFPELSKSRQKDRNGFVGRAGVVPTCRAPQCALALALGEKGCLQCAKYGLAPLARGVRTRSGSRTRNATVSIFIAVMAGRRKKHFTWQRAPTLTRVSGRSKVVAPQGRTPTPSRFAYAIWTAASADPVTRATKDDLVTSPVSSGTGLEQ